MTVRATATEVKQILGDTTLSTTVIDSYIKGANALINQVLGTEVTDLLTEIERWFAAHMIASTRERMAKTEKAGTAEIEYLGTYEGGLDSTPYGQMVKMLDTTGRMAMLGKRPVSITAITSFDNTSQS